ncbi:MAG: nuclear transport factor 2 family protein [Halioglobus sp.]
MSDPLQELLDRKACEDVLLRYGRTLDWLDEAGQTECFWPDADIDYGFYKGDTSGWLPVVMAAESASPSRWHVCSGILVEVDGDRAKSECYGLTVATVAGDDGARQATMFGGRYLDEFEKRDDEWRICKRRYIADWAHQFPDALESITDGGLPLNVLDIMAPGHVAYRKL